MDARIADLRSVPAAAEVAVQSVVVVGLGYVGLPLAVALAKSFPTVGLDIDESRIAELKAGHDRTDEIDDARLAASQLQYAAKADACTAADVYIVTVPTPVDERNRPDLRALLSASEMVGKMLDGSRKPLIIFESTVYPGVTEELCVPAMEQASGLIWKEDFFVGYSPERINPGDREHTVDRIIKVVSGDCPETTDRVSKIYERVTTGGTFRAASIKAAEGAKAIENAQRDVNIAFMNEATRIFQKLGVSIWDVIDAAKTKWNFLPFTPGLVGGHCIGVDPYYLSHRAIELGHLPEVIPAARSVNDDMARWIADTLHLTLKRRSLRVLILGVTFKEDVPDLRNSKVGDIVKRFWFHGHSVTVHDPHADAAEAERDYGVHLDPEALDRKYDLVVAAVSHRFYREMDDATLAGLVEEDGLFADVKGVFRGRDFGRSMWTL
ncbi:nucleotide sugar dehydrogenase [Sphingomonas sp. CGMCC 1.13654]|uniref:Nucleotide sugar dehydrogenase n=1 Tax=Sphingomonas chungangi TaxID=2683589 RepID=A0A838LAB0_9SPHN|nr:nucleotide sugar dehydrogenase [Sphingomonas chungangi]MBA2935772.1 nucleotide sugar dehydrogenase [Sphingomonas chungangi]MVW54463.1 nucleotide sugar dehydrogenase [Sphingomonas chungangi]